jgi:hypothetical protein
MRLCFEGASRIATYKCLLGLLQYIVGGRSAAARLSAVCMLRAQHCSVDGESMLTKAESVQTSIGPNARRPWPWPWPCPPPPASTRWAGYYVVYWPSSLDGREFLLYHVPRFHHHGATVHGSETGTRTRRRSSTNQNSVCL